jgi:hypothetical protein
MMNTGKRSESSKRPLVNRFQVTISGDYINMIEVITTKPIKIMSKTRLFDVIPPDSLKDYDKTTPVVMEIYCWACNRMVPIIETTIDKRHDEDQGGCGCYIR